MKSDLPAPRWQILLLAITRLPRNHRYVEKIYKRISTSKTHVHQLVKQLHTMGLLDLNVQGRRKPLQLTEKGAELAEALARMKVALNTR